MPAFLHNRYVRFIGIGILVVISGLILLSAGANLLTSSTGLSSSQNIGFSADMSEGLQQRAVRNELAGSADAMMIMPSVPPPGGFVSNLEAYEISSYAVTARTRTFDPLCDTIEILKADDTIDFKSLTRSTNNCRATFYVDEPQVGGVLTTLTSFNGVEVTRDTQSVTRHREQLQSRTGILRQQLASVERSLTIAETDFDEIAAFAREANDAKTLASAIREKLNLIDTLTQRKISLTSQIDSLLQQAADLEEQLNVVQFTVNISRSNPIFPNEKSRQWEQAWDNLDEQFTDTLIGLTAFFGIFLLWTVRIALYALVAIVVVRGLWKFARLVWRKW